MTIYQVTLKQKFHAQEIRNIFYYETTVGEPTTSEWQDIVDEIRGYLDTNLKASAVTDWNFYGLDYRNVSTAGLLSFSAVPTAGTLVGVSGGDSTATQIALLVSVKGVTVKPNRARTYLCGFGEGNLVDSLWASAMMASAVAFIDAMGEINVGGTNPLDRVAAQWNTGHTQVVDSNAIDQQTPVASPVPATQRRRRIGVGI